MLGLRTLRGYGQNCRQDHEEVEHCGWLFLGFTKQLPPSELENKHSLKISLYILQNQGLEFGATATTQKTQKTAESHFLIFNYSYNKLGVTGTNGIQKCRNQIIWLL